MTTILLNLERTVFSSHKLNVDYSIYYNTGQRSFQWRENGSKLRRLIVYINILFLTPNKHFTLVMMSKYEHWYTQLKSAICQVKSSKLKLLVSGPTHCFAVESTTVCIGIVFCNFFYKQILKIFKSSKIVLFFLWKCHPYDVMPVYLRVDLHTFVLVLTKIWQKWRPLIKLYISVFINST
jgi:hypothetical protein